MCIRDSHYAGRLTDRENQAAAELRVGNKEPGFTMEFWGEPPEIYNLSLQDVYKRQVVNHMLTIRLIHAFVYKECIVYKSASHFVTKVPECLIKAVIISKGRTLVDGALLDGKNAVDVNGSIRKSILDLFHFHTVGVNKSRGITIEMCIRDSASKVERGTVITTRIKVFRIAWRKYGS